MSNLKDKHALRVSTQGLMGLGALVVFTCTSCRGGVMQEPKQRDI